MRIGFDCSNFSPAYPGGTSSFVRGLVSGFVHRRGEHTIQLYLNEGNSTSFEEYDRLSGVTRHVIANSAKRHFLNSRVTAILGRLLRIGYGREIHSLYRFANDLLWTSARRLIEAHSDVVYFPATVMPVFNLRIPTFVSLHDIQQVHFPEFFTPEELHSRRIGYGLSATHASYIQASSQFMREDFLRHFKFLRPEQVFVISEGVDLARFRAPATADEDISALSLPKDFIFMPAQLWHHKNHLTLLEALRTLRDERGVTIPLVLTGAKYSSADEVLGFIERHRLGFVHYLGVVPFAQLRGLYRACRFVVMPSRFESSSLPVLEAIAMGKPVLASAIPAIVEQSRHFKIDLFEPLDVGNLASKLLELWRNPAPGAPEENGRTVERFSWDIIAQKYIDFFVEKAGARHR